MQDIYSDITVDNNVYHLIVLFDSIIIHIFYQDAENGPEDGPSHTPVDCNI